MRKKDVKLGAYYVIAHTSYNKLSVIQLLRETPYGGYVAKKLSTGREIGIKSAAKLRAEVVLTPGYLEDPDFRPKWKRVTN